MGGTQTLPPISTHTHTHSLTSLHGLCGPLRIPEPPSPPPRPAFGNRRLGCPSASRCTMIVRVLMTTIRQNPPPPPQHPPSPPRPLPSSPQSNGATRGLRCISRVKGKTFLRPPPFSQPPPPLVYPISASHNLAPATIKHFQAP